MAARPLASEIIEFCDVPRMIGMGSREMVVSPPVRIGASLLVRPSKDWNSTPAPCTGLGGTDASVTRTMIG